MLRSNESRSGHAAFEAARASARPSCSTWAASISIRNHCRAPTRKPEAPQKNGQAQPLIKLHFPDTPEGQANRLAYEIFIRTGAPAKLDLSAVEGLEDSPIGEIDQAVNHGIIEISRSTNAFLFGELRCRSTGESVIIPGLAFSTTGGTKTLTITNREQKVPLRFTFNISFGPKNNTLAAADFDLQAEMRGWSIYWYVMYVRLLRLAHKGVQVSLWDAATGIEHALGQMTWHGGEPPSDRHVELAERVLAIQNRTKQPIAIPEREFFTDADVEGILFVEAAIKKGSQRVDSMNFELELDAATDLEAQVERVVTDLTAHTEDVARLVLDTYVPLGPMDVVCTRGRMSRVDSNAFIDPTSPKVAVIVKPAGAGRITATFPAWRKK